jgi:hypothetical protein
MMAATSKLMIVEAERRFPCRIKLGIPTGGFGVLLTGMHVWLDENCGAGRWAMTPAGLRGVVNDAVAICFPRCGVSCRLRLSLVCRLDGRDTRGKAFQVRKDQPMPRAQARAHKPF